MRGEGLASAYNAVYNALALALEIWLLSQINENLETFNGLFVIAVRSESTSLEKLVRNYEKLKQKA